MAPLNKSEFASPPLTRTAATQDVAPSIESRNQELARELRRIERRDWWIWVNTIFVILVLTFAVISFTLPALLEGAETYFKIRFTEAVFGLTAFIALFSFYTVYQQVIIKRLRRQLAEKQGHTDILRSLALLDPLTGLYNRRFAEQRLAAEVARSERKGHPLTVMTLDLNNFKQINDTHGHPAGDLVLQEFAARLNNVIRGGDLAVRLGGDEFLVLLPECTSEQLQLVLGRLGSLQVDWNGQEIPITFSAGWKQYELGERPDEMMARADELLYARKRAGKHMQPLAGDPVLEQSAQTKTATAPLHVLVDLTCPRCRKKNSVAVDTHSGANDAAAREVQCAHCKQSWEPILSGPIMAGPFPK
jgi:diguanylate cyclase (GGDEF)-like protein